MTQKACSKKDVHELYEKVKRIFKERTQKKFFKHQAEWRHDYECVLNTIRELQKDARYEWEYFTSEMHARLWQEDFQGVFDCSQKLLKEECDWTGRDADVINYQIARVKLGHKAKRDKLENLIKSSEDSEVKAAAFLLLGENDDACKVLREVVNRDLSSALSCRADYIFQKMGNERIRKIIDDACEVVD